jgi:hypothetical protein
LSGPKKTDVLVPDHDFRHPFTAIRDYLQQLLRGSTAPPASLKTKDSTVPLTGARNRYCALRDWS